MANYGLAKTQDQRGHAQPLIAGAVTLTFATGPNRIIRSSGSWLASNPWESGMVADVSGTVSNDGRYTVVSVSALELEVAEAVVAEGPLNGGERVDGGYRPVFSVVRDGVFVDGPSEIDIPGSGQAGTPGAGVYQWETENNAPPSNDGRFTTYVTPAGIVLCLIVGHQILESTDDGATWSVVLTLDTLAFDTDKHCSPFTWVTGSDNQVYLCTAKQSRGENLWRVARRDDSGWVTDSVAQAADGIDFELFAWKGLLFAANRYTGSNVAYTYDPVTRSITSLAAPPRTPGTPQSFFFTLGQRLFRCQANSSGSANASANILTDVQANYTDGQTFTLTDNLRPRNTVTFEFDVTGDGVAGGNVAVDISAAVTAEDVELAIINAVNGLGNDALAISALNGGAGNVFLNQTADGSGGNTTISTTGSPPGTFPAAFTGGTLGTFGLIEWQFGTWVLVEDDFLPQLNTNNGTITRSYVRFKLDDDSVLVIGPGDPHGLGSPIEDGLECFRLYLSGGVPTAERKTNLVVPTVLQYPTTVGNPIQYLLVAYTDNTDPSNPRRILWFYPNNSVRDLQWTKLELDPVDPANNPMTVLDTTQVVDGWTLPSSYAGDGHQVWSPGGDFGVQILEQTRDALGLRIKYRVADDPGVSNKTIRFFSDDILGRPGVNGQCTLVAGSAVGGGTVVGNEVQNVDADPSITQEVVWDALADGVADGTYPHVQAVAIRP